MMPILPLAQGVSSQPACRHARTVRSLHRSSSMNRERRIPGTAWRRRRAEHTSIDSKLSWSRIRHVPQATPPANSDLTNTPMTTTAPAPLRETVSLDLLVPLADNEGVPFAESEFAAFEDRVVALTGGITRRADVEGIWRTPFGDLQRETSRSY